MSAIMWAYAIVGVAHIAILAAYIIIGVTHKEE